LGVYAVWPQRGTMRLEEIHWGEENPRDLGSGQRVKTCKNIGGARRGIGPFL